MNEAEWLANDLWDNFDVYDHRDREKLRAVVCACARRVLDVGGSTVPAVFAGVVDVAERYAGSRATRTELLAARKTLRTAIRGLPSPEQRAALVSVFAELTDDTFEGFEHMLNSTGSVLRKHHGRAFRREGVALSGLLRDIFGNPFRPVTFAPAWRTDTAVLLARQMYDAREFSAMPILADALQDAGCDNADVLNHCRSGEPHVRGCWVVDLVLGKG